MMRLPKDAERLMPIDHAARSERVGRIEELMEHYRRAKDRRLLQRAMALWRRLEARRALVKLERPRRRVH
jgi:DNA-binding transcriptional regulator YbjK